MPNAPLQHLIDQFTQIKQKLELDAKQKRMQFDYQFHKNKVIFEKTLHRAHKQLKTGALRYLVGANPLYILTAPFIYAMIVPLILLDIFAFLYQRICFPIYKIERVRRSDYLVIDRHKLGYLNIFEKINCVYCGYANGLLGYVAELASLTERIWCPIKHASKVENPHDRYWSFFDYGDAEGYVCRLDSKKNPHQSDARSKNTK
jgi:hypothetical protein